MKLDTFARKVGGKLQFIYPSQLAAFLSKLDEDAEIQIKLSAVKDSKSVKQLRLLYRIYGIIAEEIGEPINSVHVYLKNMFLEPEIIEIQGVTIVECQTLSTIPKKDMVRYINNVIDWATSFLNLRVVDSEDLNLLK